MGKHTPTPWTFMRAPMPTDGQYDCAIEAVIDFEKQIIAETFGRVDRDVFPDSQANAAFIVKAVNSHDALVKALTELRNEVSGWLSAYDPDLRQAMGNTNVAVMQDRVANAIAALASIKERA